MAPSSPSPTQRFHSPWAISLVLLADLVPPMVLGPIFGAAADRWSRRSCVIAADLVRVGAFAGVAFVDGFAATMALSLVAGVGTAMFTPASLCRPPQPRATGSASSPGGNVALWSNHRLWPVWRSCPWRPGTAVCGSGDHPGGERGYVRSIGWSARPRAVRGCAPAPGDGPARRASRRRPRKGSEQSAAFPVLAVLGASAAALFFGGLVNVAELPFVTNDLHAREAIYSMVVALAPGRCNRLAHRKSRRGTRCPPPPVPGRALPNGAWILLLRLGTQCAGHPSDVPACGLRERPDARTRETHRAGDCPGSACRPRVFGSRTRLALGRSGRRALVAAGVLLSVTDARSVDRDCRGRSRTSSRFWRRWPEVREDRLPPVLPVDLAGDAGTDRGRS